MHIKEVQEYERLTKGREFDFAALTPDFLRHCENIIFGVEVDESRYFCYHFYHDNYLSGVYQRFTSFITNSFQNLSKKDFPELHEGLANLIIFLQEPIANENNEEYKNANIKYWRDMVKDDPILKGNGSFRKYLMMI